MSKFEHATMDELFGDDDEEDQHIEDTTEASTTENSSNLVQRDPNCGALAFHDGTEEALFVHLRNRAVGGNIATLLAATDQFCYQRHWMMHIGDQKRQIIESTFLEALQKHRDVSSTAFVAVELGSYCGYSALVFAQHLDSARQEHLYCIEAHPKCVSYTHRMIEMAQLQDRVTVVEAAAGDVHRWKTLLPVTHAHIDFLFIDHDKNSYFQDLQAIDQAHLLQTGAYVVADNVLCLNRPLDTYLQYVRDDRNFVSSRLYEGFLEYTTEKEREGSNGSDLIDGIEVSIHR